MNFSCDATIFGFNLAGKSLVNSPHMKIQIWRRNLSEPYIYYKVGKSIAITRADDTGTCAQVGRIINNAHWCILEKDLLLSVLPGDILGLEVPSTDRIELYFTYGGAKNYVFERQLESTVNISQETDYTIMNQTPQISFNLTSGKITVKI